jgi:hypothetical protein
MLLRLIRFDSGSNDTLDLLFIDGVFSGFMLEDEHRAIKITGETRIPAGTYEIKYTYSPKYKKFMLEVMNVPGFTGIRIHPGNTEKDTAGCLLPGDVCRHNPIGDSRIEDSTKAYNRILKQITTALNKNDKVTITIEDNI